MKRSYLAEAALIAAGLAIAFLVSQPGALAQQAGSDGEEVLEPPPSRSSLELLRKQEERRLREEEARRAYLAETDALLRSIRSQIFEIELTIAEIDYVLNNFECAAAESFEQQIDHKLADLAQWEGQIRERCSTVSPRNQQAQEICRAQLDTTQDQVSYYTSIKGRSLRACEAEPALGTSRQGEESQ